MASLLTKSINVLRFKNVSILKQLQLEEALFRNTKENWLIFNQKTNEPSIVLGISGKPEKLINVDKAKELNLKIIRRFSGGGTVVVDNDTYFCTLILEKASLPGIEYPTALMNWTGQFYKTIFDKLNKNAHFGLRENDYVFGNKKCAGNAQSFSQTRMLHHTSFLYDFNDEYMKALKNPEKQPEYRSKRNHNEFLVPLKDYNIQPSDLFQSIEEEISKQFKLNSTIDLQSVSDSMQMEHRKNTKVVDI
ncbi:hypothetical protein WA158_000584 [Blastocystis sp. Blastoise]